jgi:hypothetical protein
MEIVFGDTLLVKKMNIINGSSRFTALGDFSKKSINLEISGFDIDLDFIGNILNFSNVLKGSANIDIKLRGKLNDIKGSMSISSTNGKLLNVPFDSLGVYIDFYNNRAYIKEASILNENAINIDVKGSFPICFNDKKSKEFVDITYEVKDNKLSILDYISNGFLEPFKGSLLFKGHIDGSYKNLKNDGKLLIYDGALRSNNYFGTTKKIFVEISLINNLIKINKFTFHSGSGNMDIKGQLRLNNFNIEDFDVRIITVGKRGIPISIPQLPISRFMAFKHIFKDYSSGEPLFDIRISGTTEKPLISGNIVLENTRFTLPDDKKDFNFFSLFPGAQFDLYLRTGNNTKFESPSGNLVGSIVGNFNFSISGLIDGSLHISGNIDNLKSEGVVEFKNRGGELSYLGEKFDILNAKLEIIDSDQIYITAIAENIITSKKIFIRRCKLSELSVVLGSKDNLNVDSQKLLPSGDDRNEIKPQVLETSNFSVGQETLKFFEQNISTPLIIVFLRKIGLADNISVSHTNINDIVPTYETIDFVNLLSGTKYTIEKNVNKNILLKYNIFFEKLDKKLIYHHGLELRYNFTRSLFVKGNFEFGSEESSHKHDRAIMLQYQLKF